MNLFLIITGIFMIMKSILMYIIEKPVNAFLIGLVLYALGLGLQGN